MACSTLQSYFPNTEAFSLSKLKWFLPKRKPHRDDISNKGTFDLTQRSPVKEEGWRQLGGAYKNTAYVGRVVKFQTISKSKAKFSRNFTLNTPLSIRPTIKVEGREEGEGEKNINIFNSHARHTICWHAICHGVIEIAVASGCQLQRVCDYSDHFPWMCCHSGTFNWTNQRECRVCLLASHHAIKQKPRAPLLSSGSKPFIGHSKPCRG